MTARRGPSRRRGGAATFAVLTLLVLLHADPAQASAGSTPDRTEQDVADGTWTVDNTPLPCAPDEIACSSAGHGAGPATGNDGFTRSDGAPGAAPDVNRPSTLVPPLAPVGTGAAGDEVTLGLVGDEAQVPPGTDLVTVGCDTVDPCGATGTHETAVDESPSTAVDVDPTVGHEPSSPEQVSSEPASSDQAPSPVVDAPVAPGDGDRTAADRDTAPAVDGATVVGTAPALGTGDPAAGGAIAASQVSPEAGTGPIAVDDRAATTTATAVVIPVLANDSSPDSALDPATVSVVGAPGGGAIAIDPATGAVTYRPINGFTGEDRFSYAVCDSAGACAQATVTVVVAAPTAPDLAGAPDLSVAKALLGELVSMGEATYRITVTNTGGAPAGDPIIVTDVLPAGLVLVDAEGAGVTCGADGATVTCTIPGPLGAGDGRTIDVAVRVTGAPGTSIANTASALATIGELDTSDNAATTPPAEVGAAATVVGPRPAPTPDPPTAGAPDPAAPLRAPAALAHTGAAVDDLLALAVGLLLAGTLAIRTSRRGGRRPSAH